MGKAKHQHWVPQFYLRQFATEPSIGSSTPQALVFDKLDPKATWKPVAIRNICGKRYLYSPIGEDGERDWQCDEILDCIESDTAPIWRELAAGQVDLADSRTREALSRFLSVMHLRNVGIFETIKRIMALRDKLFGGPNEESLARRGPDGPDPTDPGRHFVHTVIHRMDHIAAPLTRMRWTVLMPESGYFITSDRPLQYSPGTPQQAAKRRRSGVIAITPTRLLLLEESELPCATEPVRINAAIVDKINQQALASCIRFGIADRTQPITEPS